MDNYCVAFLSYSVRGRLFPCSRLAKFEHEGRNYCGTHNPIGKSKARRDRQTQAKLERMRMRCPICGRSDAQEVRGEVKEAG